MKYFYYIFTTFVVIASTFWQALFSMEENPPPEPIMMQAYDWSLRFDVGMRSFGNGCELHNRAEFAQCSKGTIFAVYDGSDLMASYLTKNFHTQLANSFFSSIEQNFNHCFQIADKWAQKNGTAGATVVIALLAGRTLTVAHCGNCRAIVFQEDEIKGTIKATWDHDPGGGPCAKEDEVERIIDAGGLIIRDIDDNIVKLQGRFCMSRAIGYYPKPYGLIAEPDVIELMLYPSNKFMILVSRGITKVIDNTKAVDLVAEVFEDDDGTPEIAARLLVNEAYEKGSRDDLIALVVRFIWEQDVRITYYKF